MWTKCFIYSVKFLHPGPVVAGQQVRCLLHETYAEVVRVIQASHSVESWEARRVSGDVLGAWRRDDCDSDDTQTYAAICAMRGTVDLQCALYLAIPIAVARPSALSARSRFPRGSPHAKEGNVQKAAR